MHGKKLKLPGTCLCAVVLALPSLAGAPAARADVLYHIERIAVPDGYIGKGSRINDAGQIGADVGPLATNLRGPWRWDPRTGWLSLGALPGAPPEGEVQAINNLGHVAGVARAASGHLAGFFWSPETGMIPIGTLPGGSSPVYHCGGLNDHDQVVGTGMSNYGQGPHSEAFVWVPGSQPFGLGDLPGGPFASGGDDINNSGVACGASWSTQGHEAFLWDSVSGMRTLSGQPPGHQALYADAINTDGQVAGIVHAPGGYRAYFWDRQAGLTVIPMPPGPFHFPVGPLRMNDRGEVAGRLNRDNYPYSNQGFVWDAEHGTRLLDDLLDAVSRGVIVYYVLDINNRGEILAATHPSLGEIAVLKPFILGDMNCDGAVDPSDVGQFVRALLRAYSRDLWLWDPFLASSDVHEPPCAGDWVADINQDGALSAFDIDPFVALLVGP